MLRYSTHMKEKQCAKKLNLISTKNKTILLKMTKKKGKFGRMVYGQQIGLAFMEAIPLY